MRKNRTFAALVALALTLALFATLSLSTLAQAENGSFSLLEAQKDAPSMTPREIAAKSRTSVVAIETETTVTYRNNGGYYSPFGSMFGYYGYPYGNPQREYTQTAAGSGVIISEDGYILTNNHVIEDADKITVYVIPEDASAEEETYEATVIGTSAENDIAVLKIDAKGLNAAVFGDSDTLDLGEQAVVIGNPMGTVHGSVTSGIISAKEHEVTPYNGATISAILTDAPVNGGNSGGPLFDEQGSVVGIIYARGSSQVENIGFAIPVNLIKDLVTAMINDPDSVQTQTAGQIMLGITIQTVTEELSEQMNMPVGVYISGVNAMSAAQRAGLQVGDIITSFAGQKVDSADKLNEIKAEQTPGDSVPIVVDRNGNEVTLTVVIPQPTPVNGSSK